MPVATQPSFFSSSTVVSSLGVLGGWRSSSQEPDRILYVVKMVPGDSLSLRLGKVVMIIWKPSVFCHNLPQRWLRAFSCITILKLAVLSVHMQSMLCADNTHKLTHELKPYNIQYKVSTFEECCSLKQMVISSGAHLSVFCKHEVMAFCLHIWRKHRHHSLQSIKLL